MTPAIGMVVFGGAFLACAAWYFWPSTAAVQTSVNEAQVGTIVKRPELKLLMSGGNVFQPDMKDVRDRLTGIVLNAKIWNTGAPGVAIEWSLIVIPQGMTPIVGQLTKIPEILRVQGAINSAVIRASESLEEKTKITLVQSVPIEGVLLFYVPIKKETVLAPSTRLELAVKDIYGSETKVSQLMGDWLRR